MASKYGINYKDYQDSDEVKRLRAANLAKEQVLSQANDRLSQPTQYGTDYADAIKQYNNRQPFQYDVASDALYNQYKDQYVKLGKTAAENVAAQSANLTGGYGNSYGTVASNQAYQDYLGKLNDIIPQLYDRARDQYDREGNDILNRINVLGNADQMEYGRNQDAYNRALGDLQLGLDQYNNERNFDYGKYSDDRSYVTNNYWQGASMQQADDQFKAQQAQRDKELAEEQRQFNLNYELQKAANNGSGGSSSSASVKIPSGMTANEYTNFLAKMPSLVKSVDANMMTEEELNRRNGGNVVNGTKNAEKIASAKATGNAGAVSKAKKETKTDTVGKSYTIYDSYSGKNKTFKNYNEYQAYVLENLYKQRKIDSNEYEYLKGYYGI